MQQASRALIAAALAVSALAAPAPAIEQRVTDLDGSYECYKGNGSPQAGWPTTSAWGSFDDLWSAQLNVLQNSCGWNGWGANNSPTEISDIKSSIQSVATSTGVDSRFILATVMQESEGCVRVPTTNNGVTNPGLMQSHNGAGTCAGKNPCPASEIQQMIQDGTAGTSSGDGLKQLLAQAQPHDTSNTLSQQVYIAARLYNSGSADYANLNDPVGATASYVNDIANRLHGWVATTARSCTPS
jgi:hypothetical protein